MQLFFIISALAGHVYYLLHTTFVDWPEMLLYPWFLTRGLLYYRDVVLAYIPGLYFLLYALYGMIGYSVQSERIIAYGFILLTDVLVYAAVREVTGKRWAAAASMVYFILWQPVLSGNSIWYETVLAPIYLVLFILIHRYLRRPSLRQVMYIALCLAAASLIKQTAVWVIAATALIIWLGHANKKTGFVYAIPTVVLPFLSHLAVFGIYAALGAGREFLYWTYGFLFDLTRPESRYVMLPSGSELRIVAPLLIPFAALPFLPGKRKASVAVIVLAVFLSAAGLPRWGLVRLQPALAMGAVALGMSVQKAVRLKKRPAAYAVIFLTGLLIYGMWSSTRIFLSVRDRMQPQFFDRHYEDLADAVRERVRGPVFVLGRYDYLYLSLDQKPVVLPWTPAFPWNTEVPGVQENLIASIEETAVPYILYLPFHPDNGFYEGYVPRSLIDHVFRTYEIAGNLPVEGGMVLRRK